MNKQMVLGRFRRYGRVGGWWKCRLLARGYEDK